jgi:hypothetical protein
MSQRCIICDYTINNTIQSEFNEGIYSHQDFRRLSRVKDKDAFICSECNYHIEDALSEFTEEPPVDVDTD